MGGILPLLPEQLALDKPLANGAGGGGTGGTCGELLGIELFEAKLGGGGGGGAKDVVVELPTALG